MQWDRIRIEQVQTALASHTALPPAAPQTLALVTVPADPAWEAAKAGGLIPLFSQDEIAAYSEIADVVGRARPRLEVARNAHVKLGDFEKRYQFVGVEATPGYRLESTADLQSYLDLLLTDQSALDGLRAMTAVVKGAEAAILDGERDHGRVEDREIAALKSLPK